PELAKSAGIEISDATNSPRVGEDSGRDAKADECGTRMELRAKFGVAAGEARNAAIQRIKNDGDADSFGSVIEIFGRAEHGRHNSVVAAKQVRRGHHGR